MPKPIIITLAGLALVASPLWAGPNQRQHRQDHRIAQGVRSGELTGREAAGLVRQQRRIARTEARMRADGGGLSHAERARLAARQDRASAAIYRQKHDGQAR